MASNRIWGARTVTVLLGEFAPFRFSAARLALGKALGIKLLVMLHQQGNYFNN